MALAVVALGALAVWAAIVTQNGALGLSRVGVQTSGQLRAVQALSVLDTQTDAVEEGGLNERMLSRLRRAQGTLREALARMETGGVVQASRVARLARPYMRRLDPAVSHFLAGPRAGREVDAAADVRMDEIIGELQQLLNQSGSDPSELLASQLEDITASERKVRGTAFVLVPLGLGGVVVCGWLLSSYRRRSEALMHTALDMTAREARTDHLTGLPNRRALLEEFERLRAQGEQFTLALADLNGFKRYNDAFGHPAGDALLRRLGQKLAADCDGKGIAARLGGDEFCLLLSSHMPVDEVPALLHQALSEEGEGFRITAACGIAAVPEEAADSSSALRIADNRMYAAKVSVHPSAEHAMSAVLTRMLEERHPGLASHGRDVAELAAACAQQLGLRDEQVKVVERAGQLHDLGKVGIPSAILSKPGPLSDEERDFMRRHSIIGERILAGVPSMEGVAPLIRAVHERWSGRGYPDGLAGEEIPIGARIVAVAEAFCAMTQDRPYAPARSVQGARAELGACSGTQFDPQVVAAFLNALDRRETRAVARRQSAAVH